ncbi:MAG: PAS domain S-box protein [Candidatus Thermoplasmatota archaeon]|nr:PAS domain S-box protein [Candidatus Thermoplasmatota archaeon]
MKKDSQFFWYFPFYFITFLTIYVIIKFTISLIFRASFEPDVIFQLTPFFAFSGLEELQILFINMVVLVFSSYLHINDTRKNIYYSFIPTTLFIAGIGLSIASSELSLSQFLNYLIFGCFILVALVDHRRLLTGHELLIYRAITRPIEEPKKSIVLPDIRSQITTAEPLLQAKLQPKILIKKSKPYKMVRKPSKLIKPILLKISHSIFLSLNKLSNKVKSKVLPRLKKTIAAVLSEENKIPSSYDLSARFDFEEYRSLIKEFGKKSANLEQIDEFIDNYSAKYEAYVAAFYNREGNYKQDGQPQLDTTNVDIKESDAIIRRGVFKNIDPNFSKILGYSLKDMLEKELINFVDPESTEQLKKHIIKRLRGIDKSSFETTFLTKNKKKISMKASTAPITYDGEKADIIKFEKIENKLKIKRNKKIGIVGA